MARYDESVIDIEAEHSRAIRCCSYAHRIGLELPAIDARAQLVEDGLQRQSEEQRPKRVTLLHAASARKAKRFRPQMLSRVTAIAKLYPWQRFR